MPELNTLMGGGSQAGRLLQRGVLRHFCHLCSLPCMRAAWVIRRSSSSTTMPCFVLGRITRTHSLLRGSGNRGRTRRACRHRLSPCAGRSKPSAGRAACRITLPARPEARVRGARRFAGTRRTPYSRSRALRGFCAQQPSPPSGTLLFGHAAPDPVRLLWPERERQAFAPHRAGGTDSLRLRHLFQGLAGIRDREEQLRISGPAGGG